MNPRLRRLHADQQRIAEDYRDHPRILIVSTEGEPAEKYVVEYRVAALVPTGATSFQRGGVHRAEIFLPLDYPRRAPFCRMITPVFHPNIDPQKICIGDHWSAGEQLADLILRIGEMLTYQSYNVKSPLNAEAARWAEENLSALPLDAVDLSTR
jgi:ubiquitin-protein ligase